MARFHGLLGLSLASFLATLAAAAAAQDANITQPVAELERLLAAEPLVITEARISRPNARGDITLRADVSFGGAPPLRVIVGEEVHVSVIGALRLLGIGSRQIVRVAADDQGRMRPEALAAVLAGSSTTVRLKADTTYT